MATSARRSRTGLGGPFGPARRAFAGVALAGAGLGAAPGCGGDDAGGGRRACDQACQDGIAVRALRETVKLAFNLAVQGGPVGARDATVPCVTGGSVRVHGEVGSNAEQGGTEVRLTYELSGCRYLQREGEDAGQNFAVTFDGSLAQEGLIAVQPTATTSLSMSSASMSFSGDVYDPPLPYEAAGCAVDLVQNRGRVSGTICGRDAGFDL